MHKERLYELDIITGIAIFLVVLGHLASRGAVDIDWYVTLKTIIYKFHMPLFMFISGAVFYYTLPQIIGYKKYLIYVTQKAKRILPGFFIFAIVIVFGKYFASFFLHVDNFNFDVIENIINMLFYVSNSSAGSLWYIYVLFELYVLFPILLLTFKDKSIYLLLFTSTLHILSMFLDITNFLMINLVLEFSLYFSLGIFYIKYRKNILKLFHRNQFCYLVLLLSLIITAYVIVDELPSKMSKLIIGSMSIPVVLIIVLRLNFDRIKHHLMFLSGYSYTIYLMNTIFIGLLKGVGLTVLDWNNLNFMIMFPFLVFGGLYLPIYTHKLLLSKTVFKTFTK